MAKPEESYYSIVVESYRPSSTSGLHGTVHIRPIAGQLFSPTLQVECAKELSTKYPVGTRFKLKVKLTDREGVGEYLYSNYKWNVEVLGEPAQSS